MSQNDGIKNYEVGEALDDELQHDVLPDNSENDEVTITYNSYMTQHRGIATKPEVDTPLHYQFQHDTLPDDSKRDEETLTYNPYMTQHRDIATKSDVAMPLSDGLQHSLLSDDSENDEETLTHNSCMTQQIAAKSEVRTPMQDELQKDKFSVCQNVTETEDILNKKLLIRNKELFCELCKIISTLLKQSSCLDDINMRKSSINFGTVSEIPSYKCSIPFRITKTDAEVKEIEASLMEETENIRNEALGNLINYKESYKKYRLIVNDIFHKEAEKEITSNKATGSERSRTSMINFKDLLTAYNDVLVSSKAEFDEFVHSIKCDLNGDLHRSVDFLINAFDKGHKAYYKVRSFFLMVI